MTLRQFIKEHKEDIDYHIHLAMRNFNYKLNNNDREDWILNDENLYLWAIDEGCRI